MNRLIRAVDDRLADLRALRVRAGEVSNVFGRELWSEPLMNTAEHMIFAKPDVWCSNASPGGAYIRSV